MAEREAPKPILMNELTLPQKVMLGQTSLTPGFQVIVMMIEAACQDATRDAIKVDPEDPAYDQILKARQQYARTANKFSTLLLKSIEYHTEHGIAEERQLELDAAQLIQKD